MLARFVVRGIVLDVVRERGLSLLAQRRKVFSVWIELNEQRLDLRAQEMIRTRSAKLSEPRCIIA